MPFHIILENVAGKRAESMVDTEEQVRDAVIEIVRETELRDGDIIRIVEQSYEELEGRPDNGN